MLARAAAAVAVIVEEQGAVGVKGNPAFSHAGLMETLAQPFGVEGGIGALVRRANQRFHDVEIEEQVLRSRGSRRIAVGNHWNASGPETGVGIDGIAVTE